MAHVTVPAWAVKYSTMLSEERADEAFLLPPDPVGVIFASMVLPAFESCDEASQMWT